MVCERSQRRKAVGAMEAVSNL
ncbi:uncharacterized protein G2W53_028668 [Senna tora]|uniref:Uncharacterized protein n=1 Tax=Senna tora TaxID=362788 RepID=A0A834WF05_9FABA|nr:uncharacterized protein G2W53_028668 [Senna tora]